MLLVKYKRVTEIRELFFEQLLAEMYIADALSRNHDIKIETHDNENDVLQVSEIDINVANVPMSKTEG